MNTLSTSCPYCTALVVGAIGIIFMTSRNPFLMANIKEILHRWQHKLTGGDRYDKIREGARLKPWFGMDKGVCIVTGSNSGMGYEIALDLAKTGCHVILAVRNESKGSEAAEKIKSLSGNSRVDVMIVDMSRIASVQTFANAFAARKLPLHVLVHNAGAPSERVQMSEEGLEENMALNYTSVVLLTSLLLPVMKTSTPSARVVLVSSSAHFQGKREVALSLADCEQQISGWVLYGSSKLNLTAYGESLAKKLSQAKSMVSVCSLDPGFVATPFYTKELPFPISIFAKLVSLHGKTPEEGAHSALYACLSKEPLPNGTYLADTLESTPSVRVRDAAFQEELMRNTTTKLQKVAPWWDGKWF